ncbi:MAG TPA: PQQ-binding-like beta-propeller repeat protein [Gemmatimonadaceae bacterium]
MSVIAGLIIGQAAPSVDSAMFRGGPEHSGIYASPTSPALSQVVWKFKTDAKILSSPLVHGSSVYVGSADHNLYALERQNGSVRWKFATGGAVNSSPAYMDGSVYVVSLDGRLYAVDAETGKERWRFTTMGERRFTAPGIHGAQPRTEMMADPFDVFLSSPAVANGIVYFGSGDNNVYAVNAADGKEKWHFTTGNVVHASPAVVNGVVYIGSWDRNMYALDANTGREIWRFQTGNDTAIYNQVGIASSAAVVNGVVYFGCRDGHFYAVDATTGKQKWSNDNKMGWVIASPAVQNGIVYFPTSDGTRFKALDAETGALRYSVENKAVSFSSPAIVNDVVYFGSSDGWLHALDKSTGAVKAEFQTDGSKANASKYIDANGRMNSRALYPDVTLDGMIIGMDRMFSLGSVLSSPVVADGVLYVGSTDGNLYALR